MSEEVKKPTIKKLEKELAGLLILKETYKTLQESPVYDFLLKQIRAYEADIEKAKALKALKKRK